MTRTEIGKIVGMSDTATSKYSNHLVDSNWLIREKDPDNRRSSYIKTKEAILYVNSVKKKYLELSDKVFNSLDKVLDKIGVGGPLNGFRSPPKSV